MLLQISDIQAAEKSKELLPFVLKNKWYTGVSIVPASPHICGILTQADACSRKVATYVSSILSDTTGMGSTAYSYLPTVYTSFGEFLGLNIFVAKSVYQYSGLQMVGSSIHVDTLRLLVIMDEDLFTTNWACPSHSNISYQTKVDIYDCPVSKEEVERRLAAHQRSRRSGVVFFINAGVLDDPGPSI